MEKFIVKVLLKQDFDDPGQQITQYTITAKNKIQAINQASKQAKQDIQDYNSIKHDLYYVAELQ